MVERLDRAIQGEKTVRRAGIFGKLRLRFGGYFGRGRSWCPLDMLFPHTVGNSVVGRGIT